MNPLYKIRENELLWRSLSNGVIVKYLITGHTGFKGSWLSAILVELGHEVIGISQPAVGGGIYERAQIDDLITSSYMVDIRDSEKVDEIFQKEKPSRVIHLAAQPLVSDGYIRPAYTFETNVNGTLNILRAASKLNAIESTMIVTTDKVYKNSNKTSGYTEEDPLGGIDPYSASKSMADLLAQSWSNTFPMDRIGILRAGNVIGGGDVSENRLLPDLVKAAFTGQKLHIRSPKSVRPWQHVLDCLHGYILAESRIVRDQNFGIWNFGPDVSDFASVETVVTIFEKYAEKVLIEKEQSAKSFQETEFLTLNSKKAREELIWEPIFGLDDSIRLTIEWERLSMMGQARSETMRQIQDFLSKQ